MPLSLTIHLLSALAWENDACPTENQLPGKGGTPEGPLPNNTWMVRLGRYEKHPSLTSYLWETADLDMVEIGLKNYN